MIHINVVLAKFVTFKTLAVFYLDYGSRSKTIEELATIPPTVSRLITRGKHTEMSAYITRIVKSGSFVDVHIEWERFLGQYNHSFILTVLKSKKI